jgi:hypothetical protein
MSSETENTSDQENIIENKIQIEEDSTYPLDNNIMYRERINKITKRSFNYVIIKEGVYPDKIITGSKSKKRKHKLTTRNGTNNFKKRSTQQYKIPHGYVVETTWGRAAKKRTVRCEIDYVNTIPQFRIKYGSNFRNVVSSTLSTSNAAFKYEQVKILFFLFSLFLNI